MSVKSIKLNSVACTDKTILFGLNVSDDDSAKDGLFYADVEPTTSMSDSQNTNKYNLYNFTQQHVIANMYPLEKLHQRSSPYRYNKATAKGDITDHVDISIPLAAVSNPIAATQNGNGIYILNDLTKKDYEISRYDFDKHKIVKTDSERKTYLYRPTPQTDNTMLDDPGIMVKSMVLCSDADDSLLSALYATFQAYTNLSGIYSQYVTEIPAQMPQHYDSGEILANSFLTKSHLNSLYSMNLGTTIYTNYDSISTNLSNVTDQGTGLQLIGAREYTGIGTCGNMTYLKYTDNIFYIGYIPNYDKDTSLCAGGLYDVVDLSNVVDPKVYNLHMYAYQSPTTYQHIETIESVNRFKYVQHKSNMYSIEINDAGIMSSKLSDHEKELIKKDVENNVRLIAKQLCPLNTELFAVYWKGN